MRLIKILFFCIVLIFLNGKCVLAEELQSIIESQKDSIGIHDLIGNSKEYTSDVFSEDELYQLLKDAINGKIDKNVVMKNSFSIFSKELKGSINVIGSIVLIIVVNGILKCITEGLDNKSVCQIADYVQIILIITVILTNFSEIVYSVKSSVNNMVDFVNMLSPVIVTLIITTGNVTTATMLQPILLFMTSLIGNFINSVAIPIVLISTSLGIISNISDKVQINRLAKRLKSATIWIIGIILTIFVTLISMEGSLSQGVDAVTSKTTKAAISNLVPVVGKILGDAVDSVIGCSSILKNAVGMLGVIIIIGICMIPIIKLAILMGMYYLTSAVCEPIADKKIVKLLDQMGDTFKILLGFMCSMMVAIIIGTTLVIKISNTGYS